MRFCRATALCAKGDGGEEVAARRVHSRLPIVSIDRKTTTYYSTSRFVTEDRRRGPAFYLSQAPNRIARKGTFAGKDFRHHDPEREDVRPLINRLSEHLLRRHVGKRPEDNAGQAHAQCHVAGGDGQPCQAEIEHLDPRRIFGAGLD